MLQWVRVANACLAALSFVACRSVNLVTTAFGIGTALSAVIRATMMEAKMKVLAAAVEATMKLTELVSFSLHGALALLAELR
jgi:nicotinic acid phosphoribosyltransferase